MRTMKKTRIPFAQLSFSYEMDLDFFFGFCIKDSIKIFAEVIAVGSFHDNEMLVSTQIIWLARAPRTTESSSIYPKPFSFYSKITGTSIDN